MTNKAFIYYQWNDYNLKEPPHKANNQNANEKLKKEILLIVYREYQLICCVYAKRLPNWPKFLATTESRTQKNIQIKVKCTIDARILVAVVGVDVVVVVAVLAATADIVRLLCKWVRVCLYLCYLFWVIFLADKHC